MNEDRYEEYVEELNIANMFKFNKQKTITGDLLLSKLSTGIEHKCHECGKVAEKGEEHKLEVYETSMFVFETVVICRECLEAMFYDMLAEEADQASLNREIYQYRG